MAVLVLDNIPAEVLERLEKLAAKRQHSLSEEALNLLQLGICLRESPAPRMPDFVPGEEIVASYDLPRSSIPIPVDVVPATSPRLLEFVPEEEIPAPCDLPRSGKAVRVHTRPARLPRLPDPLIIEGTSEVDKTRTL